MAIERSRAGRSVLTLEAGSEQLNTWKHPIPEDELDAERPYRDVAIDGQRSFGFGGTIADPAQGVVDPDCKVHGIDNLHVAGCSVFPVGGYQNPTIPMTALAIRLGQRLAAGPG